MTTSSRSIARKRRVAVGKKPSQTPGRSKNEWCQKSELKEFGRKANPYKLRGQPAIRYRHYAAAVDSINTMKREYTGQPIN